MPKKKFEIVIRGRAMIELDEKVIDAVDDEWRKYMYNIHTPEEIAEHVAYGMVVGRDRLSMIDGWNELDDSYAEVLEEEWDDWDVTDITEQEAKDA